MARTRKAVIPEAVNAEIHDQDLYAFSERQIVDYATEVNLERSVPDIYDGLKPVHRRILWSAHPVAKASGEPVKSATIVGDVLGKYHPKGDGSVYGALVTLVQGQLPTMFGDGNFGSLTDEAAAYRYTNAKLSEYGATFFDSNYIVPEVTTFVPNFDDRTVEPVTLPAMLPNVLLNSNEGIGVGITTNLPAFTVDSVCKVIDRLLAGEKLTAEDFAATLKPELKWGGRLVKTKDNMEAWVDLFKGTSGAVQYTANLEVDEDRRQIVIREWPPGLTPEALVKKVRAIEGCEDVANTAGNTEYTITMKRGYNLAQFQAFVKKVQKVTIVRKAYKMNVTQRSAETVDGVTTHTTKFLSMSIPAILTTWLKMRIELETKSLNYRIEKQKRLIERSKLLIYAASIKDVIRKAWDAPDDVKYLTKNSKLTEDQARELLEMKIKTLSRLDQEAVQEQLKSQEKQLGVLEKWLTRPKKKIRGEIAELGAKTFWRYDPDSEMAAIVASRNKRKSKA